MSKKKYITIYIQYTTIENKIYLKKYFISRSLSFFYIQNHYTLKSSLSIVIYYKNKSQPSYYIRKNVYDNIKKSGILSENNCKKIQCRFWEEFFVTIPHFKREILKFREYI